MHIRTITIFDNPGFPVDEARLARAGRVTGNIKATLEAAGYTVQTVRLALPPFAPLVDGDARRVVVLAQQLEAACAANSIDYATIGAALARDPPEMCAAIPEAIGATTRVFGSALVTDPVAGVVLPAVRLAAEVIYCAARLTPDGFGNLRFAALANVPPGVPFLPAAYHDDRGTAVAIGLEAADLAVQACTEARSLPDARARLVHLIEGEAERVLD
ncbi:MAG: DUF711 family protein, partial [Acidobacteria bacterium]|nr:DUF711 family protein [Acidobacteriota bacterium]